MKSSSSLYTIAPTRSADDPGGHHFNERVVSQLLTELDGLEVLRQVVVIGATNRPDMVDPALLRAGRFDRLLYVPPADLSSRIQIIKIHTQLTPLAQDVQIEKIAESTEGFTGADIASFISAAIMLALRDHVFKYQDPNEAEQYIQELVVHMHHFEEEMGKIRPLSVPELEMYKKMAERVGRPQQPTTTKSS